MEFDIYIYKCNGTSDRSSMYGCTLQIYNGFTIGEFPKDVEISDVKISDIFEDVSTKGYKTSELNIGTYPLIMSGSTNNGITKYVDKYSYDGNCISVCTTGSVGYCFAQCRKICLLDSSAHPPSLISLKSEYQFLQPSLGLLAYLMTEKFTKKYNYSTKLNNSRLMNETIKLPTIKGRINENLLNAWVYETLL